MDKIKILVIVGPTASGKTALSISCAEKFGGEIVSADSMQIYEGLIKFNPKDLSIIPSLAEKWEIDSTKTIYTFHLKKVQKNH